MGGLWVFQTDDIWLLEWDALEWHLFIEEYTENALVSELLPEPFLSN